MDKEKIKKDLADLIKDGQEVHLSGMMEHDSNFFKTLNTNTQKMMAVVGKKFEDPKGSYHTWYAKAYRMVRMFAPERLEEFEKFYTGDKTIKKLADLNPITAGITHYIQGWIIPKDENKVDFVNTFVSGMKEQIYILIAIIETIDDDIYNLESGIHYEIYQSEMDIARDLYKKKFYRAAGSIAGVVIEVHLKKIVANRGVPLADKADPGMSAYNDALKKHDIYKTPTFSLIQMCGQIRNKCVHPKEEEPTAGEISSIISAAERILVEVP